MVFDFHNDLLSYLEAHPHNSPLDEKTRSSLIHLRQGGVQFQVYVVFAVTGRLSTRKGMRQAKLYNNFLNSYSEYVQRYIHGESASKLQAMLAIENMSSCFEENEPFEKGMQRLKQVVAIEKPLYISCTWNGENRFGGGAHTHVGLKGDGKRLLDEMQGLCHAIDLSHASDALARDILAFCDTTRLPYAIMASHSNFRAIHEVPRNLPEELAAAIVQRGGIIGLNFIRPFVGKTIESFFSHVEYALDRGWEGHIGFGADFFSPQSIGKKSRGPYQGEMFFDEVPTAAAYPYVLERISKRFGKRVMQKLQRENAEAFLNRCMYTQ